jgi:SAM-dependent methyltransferase
MPDRPQRLVFGEDAELYDRARPGYPAELFDELTDLAGGPGRAVDAGCGTGKAALPLARRGWAGTGVEPDPAMAAVASRQLADHPNWTIEVVEWERWRGGPVDLVVSAQAWHWFDPALRSERARAALVPGGLLALWWNRDGDPDEANLALDRDIDAVYDAVVPGFPVRRPGGKVAVPGSAELAGFELVIERSYPWRRRQTGREVVETLHTQSDHRLLVAEVFARLASGIEAAVADHGGVDERAYRTDLWVARRQP